MTSDDQRLSELREEALNRLKDLSRKYGLSTDVTLSFERGQLTISELEGIRPIKDGSLLDKIRQYESQTSSLAVVYHIIHTVFKGDYRVDPDPDYPVLYFEQSEQGSVVMDLYSLLYVSSNEGAWPFERCDDEGIIMAYVINKNDVSSSELGEIRVAGAGSGRGSLIRLF